MNPHTFQFAGHRPRVVVLAVADRAHVQEAAALLRPEIERHAEIVLWDLELSQDLAQVEADLAVVLGGDGSILRAAHQMAYQQIPVVGVNLGKLGFLADLSLKQFQQALPDLSAGRFKVVDHLMFECRLERGGKVLWTQLGLNEVTIHAGAPFTMLEVHLRVDAELVTTYSCDGLIVSTPVGSTAHSLSSGGPILRKDLQAFVISPISAHTLTNRPVVDLADRVYEMVVPRPNAGTAVVVDGRVRETLEPDDCVIVRRAAPQFRLVEIAGHGYYRTLREKLGWGGQLNLHDKTSEAAAN